MGIVTEGIAKAVLLQERHPRRFESFSNDLVGHIEGGVKVVSTSASWDLGRDGRAYGPGGVVYTCCSLSDKVEEKAAADLERLGQHIRGPARVYFLSSQPLSEHACAQIEADCGRLLPENSVVIAKGLTQISEYGAHHEEVLRRHYGAEVAECIALLRGEDGQEEQEDVALRLALAASGCEQSADVREALYQDALRTVLSDGESRNVAECARDVSAAFRLSRLIPAETISHYLERLEDSDEIEHVGTRFRITSEGRTAFESRETEAVNSYLEGRARVRKALERAIGDALSDDNFAAVWGVLQEKLTHYFFTRGQEMVRAVSAILNEEEDAKVEETVETGLFFVRELAEAVAATAVHPDRKEELRTAISDIFEERSGPVFDWLSELCAAFIALCSLGLEVTSGKAIAHVLSRMTLVFDTDVVLSLLGIGEPDHDGAVAIQKRWRALGGRLLVAEPVLRELAHHAWIAEVDFRAVERWLPGKPEERIRLIENAFVRSFAEMLARKEARKAQWSSYVRQFRGRTETDSAPIANVLKQEYGFELLGPRSSEEASLEKNVAGYLIARAEKGKAPSRELRRRRDKARRDASLYSAMVREVKACRSAEAGASCFLLSSSRRLVEAEEKFAEAGEPHFVVSIPVALYLLTLVPNVSLGMSALRSFLFESRAASMTPEIERTLFRVLRESGEFDVPWAKRGTLVREVRIRFSATRAGLVKERRYATVRGL